MNLLRNFFFRINEWTKARQANKSETDDDDNSSNSVKAEHGETNHAKCK